MPHGRHGARRFLATVLFTDVVGSTEFATRLGDRAWRLLLEQHHAIVRRQLRLFGGREMDTAGDGFFAVFEAPERAVRCVESISSALTPIGVHVRAGVHMGECEVVDGKVGGITVTIGARIAAEAEADQVLVSGSVRDMTLGSGLAFEGRGERKLKGVDGVWQVFRLIPDSPHGETGGSGKRVMIPLYTRRQRRRVVTVLVALLVLALAVSAGYVLTRSNQEVLVGENSVGGLEGDAVTAAIRVGARPSGIAVGAGAVWVTNSTGNTVSRIDPDTHAASTVPVGTAPAGVAVGAGAVWVANSGDGTVSRIDPQTNRVSQIRVLPGPTGVVVAAGSVWVTNTLAGAVTQIDPAHLTVLHTVRVGANPTGIAYGAHSLWVTNQSDGTVTRLDPESRRPEAPIKVGAGPVGIAVGDGAAWVANNLDGSLSRIDVDDNSVTSRTIAANGGIYGVAASGRTVWVSNEYAGTLSRVDTQHFTLVSTVRTQGAPLGLALSGDRLWFASAEAGKALHRGGVLRFAAQGPARGGGNDPDVVDPANAFDQAWWRLLAMTNDGLVAFRRTGGLGGSLLVPDLATTVPVPTDDGLTYTFHLRRGVRYSTGQPVRPGDIRRGIERAMQNQDGLPYLAIKGADKCSLTVGSCDLSAGIDGDDRAGTVTFRLTKPEPDFLSLLALSWAYATPTGTPMHLPKGTWLPATGPYMINTYDPAPIYTAGQTTGPGRLELVRNPHFRQWSGAAQPAGYPDRIVIDFGLSQKQALERVADGQADAVWDQGVPPDQAADLQARFPTFVHAQAGIFMQFVFLNTTIPPFDNRDARRAVAYAMNRRKLASDPTAWMSGQVTCQLLPPDFPGYDRYCPYTVDGGEPGEWTAPDLLEAQRLVRVSGTKGAAVDVAVPDFAAARKSGQQVVDLLRSLQYSATLRPYPRPKWDYVLKSSNHVQAGVQGFGANWPGSASYLPAIVTCHGWFNSSFFCDTKIDKQIDRALDRQVTDPSGAAVLWAAIDKAVVDEAPIIPFANELRYDFISPRIGNYQYHPLFGQLPAQMWVQ